MALPLSRRATYSLPALKKYLAHISLPSTHSSALLGNATRQEWGASSDALQGLRVLQKYQQARIPFANLHLHYSRHHLGTLEPEGLYRYIMDSKAIAGSSCVESMSWSSSGYPQDSILSEDFHNILSQRGRDRSERERKWDRKGPSGGRGGSCTANNGFFGTVMRSLGMSVRITGARVSKVYQRGPELAGQFDGWNHLVNLVGFEGKRYLVDVGFGGNGPTAPLEILDGNEMSWGSTDDKVRLIHTHIPEFEDPTSKVWLLQHKRSSSTRSPSSPQPEPKWTDIYAFTTIEFLPQDISVMNFKTTRDIRDSFFNYMVICLKTEMEGEDVVGWTSLVDGKVKRMIRGRKETLQVCGNEVERWEALERWFGIVLGEEERAGIRGSVTELRGAHEED